MTTASDASADGGASGNAFYIAIQVGDGNIQNNNYFQFTTPDPVEAAARDLAGEVHRQWRGEALRRGLFGPVPIPVPFRSVRGGEFGDHPHLSGGTAEGSAKDLGVFTEAFLALRQQRLVVLGEAGAGKTTLAVMLVIELAQRMQAGDAVPVLLPLASWRPSREHLYTWLECRLLREYPQLTAAMARKLIGLRRILPVLDGLDELPLAQQPVALKSLNDALAGGGPLILTCRTSAYTEAVRTASVLRAAAVVRADPLSANVAATYLEESFPPQHEARWKPVLDELDTRPDGALARSLSVPLLLWLARTIYEPSDTRPAELADISRFPDVEDIERHLLDALIPAVYPQGPVPPSQHGRHPPRSWHPDAVERWLGILAVHLTRLGTENFAWWELHLLRPRRTLLRRVCVLAGLVLAGWPFGLLVEELSGAVSGPTVAAYIGWTFFVASVPVQHFGALGPVRFLPGGRWPIIGLHPGLLMTVLFTGLGVTVGVANYAPWWAAFLVFAAALPAAAFAALLLLWLLATVTKRVERREASSPQSSLAVSRRRTLEAAFWLTVLITLLISAPAFAAALVGLPRYPGGSPFGPADALPEVQLAVAAASFTVVMTVARSPWAAYLLSRSSLAARGLAPWHLGRFLAEAHRRGVLRQAGSVYQFRHAKVRDRLAERCVRYAPRASADASGEGWATSDDEEGWGTLEAMPPGNPSLFSRTRRGQDSTVPLHITLEESVFGAVKEVSVDTVVQCDTCSGSGTTGMSREECAECRGQGRLKALRTLTVRIPAGVREGFRIQLTGEGRAGPGGGPPGDLYVELHEQKHPRFIRIGDDLHCSMRIPRKLAAGGSVDVQTLDGLQKAPLPDTSKSRIRLRLPGLGAPRGRKGGRGDLYVVVRLED